MLYSLWGFISESDVHCLIRDTLDGHITEELTSDHSSKKGYILGYSCVLMCRCCELHN